MYYTKSLESISRNISEHPDTDVLYEKVLKFSERYKHIFKNFEEAHETAMFMLQNINRYDRNTPIEKFYLHNLKLLRLIEKNYKKRFKARYVQFYDIEKRFNTSNENEIIERYIQVNKLKGDERSLDENIIVEQITKNLHTQNEKMIFCMMMEGYRFTDIVNHSGLKYGNVYFIMQKIKKSISKEILF